MGLSFQKISEYISLNGDILKDKDDAYSYLHKILSDKELSNDLSYDEFASVIKKLGLSLCYIFQKADWDITRYIDDLITSQEPENYFKIIHSRDDHALMIKLSASNGRIDDMDYLLKSLPDQETRNKMIHSNYDYAFRFAARYGHTEILKYLVSIEKETESRSKMIHSWDEQPMIWTARYGHTETLKYLISLEEIAEARSNMIHAIDDQAFRSAAYHGHTEIIKYLVVSDPFYEWPNYSGITNLNYYKNIDIKSLCKISTLCKYLFSTERNSAKNNEDDISIIDLPIEILYKILHNLAQVDDEHSSRMKIESIVKAFTYDISNYSEGFMGFTCRYELALKELGAIENITNDLE